jgi:hypothetical protein
MKAPDFQKAVHERGFGAMLSTGAAQMSLNNVCKLPAYSNTIDERLWIDEFSELLYRVRARVATKLWKCRR